MIIIQKCSLTFNNIFYKSDVDSSVLLYCFGTFILLKAFLEATLPQDTQMTYVFYDSTFFLNLQRQVIFPFFCLLK